jgi:hypothetical protein
MLRGYVCVAWIGRCDVAKLDVEYSFRKMAWGSKVMWRI